MFNIICYLYNFLHSHNTVLTSSLTAFPSLCLSCCCTVTWSCPSRAKETTWIWNRSTTLSMCPCWRWGMPLSTQTSRGPTMTTHPLRKDRVVRTSSFFFSSVLLFTPFSRLLVCSCLAAVLCVWVSVGWLKGPPLSEFRPRCSPVITWRG